jgi:putative redox protein
MNNFEVVSLYPPQWTVDLCSSFHVLTILKKKRQKVSGYSVEATAERREDPPPRVFTKIHLKYKVKGQDISPQAVESAIKL